MNTVQPYLLEVVAPTVTLLTDLLEAVGKL
jgi:hypothetical protein